MLHLRLSQDQYDRPSSNFVHTYMQTVDLSQWISPIDDAFKGQGHRGLEYEKNFGSITLEVSVYSLQPITGTLIGHCP